ncbi:SPOR domain-containing protein [Virgibacillus sp. NKC19-16]|uniref:SPOR domain-containing protein n=1 Tax=Virgibacillus salidurans TaxID=2831673 RepID=UPI001F2C6486|nr:SPOR domain-containing protein [Virgibacillus sp. NKC19-16]UJL44971.1 SPOR domain-containing protein [Virgibacillus sp. NKC19-16]
MDKKKIVLWKVGKSKKHNREQAATLQDSEDDLPTFARGTDHKPSKKQNKWKPFKPIILTTISAIAIGSILGVIMLRMFVGIDSDLAENNNLPAATIDNSEEENNNAENTAPAIEQMNAYVLQGGVFSDQANAEEWVSRYEQAGLSSFIWEREEQYFLLVGLAKTEGLAEQLANQLKEYQFDIYVKEWNTERGGAEFTDNEHDWLQSFHKNWQDTLNALENDEGFTADNWEALIENHPEDSENLAGLIESLLNYQESIQAQAEGFEAQQILLHLWQQYSNVTN